jgi:anti-anti-sigma factor
MNDLLPPKRPSPVRHERFVTTKTPYTGNKIGTNFPIFVFSVAIRPATNTIRMLPFNTHQPGEPHMEIAISQAQGSRPVTVFTVTGTIDSATYQQLEQQAREAHAAGTHDLVIDLAGVHYVSSAGIRALNNILKFLQTDAPEDSQEAMSQGLRDGTWRSRHLKLAGANKHIIDAFKIAGVDMLLEMYPDAAKAVASY